MINLRALLARAVDLNHAPNDIADEIVQHKGNYDYPKISEDLLGCKNELCASMEETIQYDVGAALNILDNTLNDILKSNKIKTVNTPCQRSLVMAVANKAFDEYIKVLNDSEATENVIEEKLKTYMNARKAITKEMMTEEDRKWNDLIKENDSKRFWSFINWKGNVQQKKQTEGPSVHEFEAFFEDLYRCDRRSCLG